MYGCGQGMPLDYKKACDFGDKLGCKESEKINPKK